jgi:hypothetical protein
MIIGPFEDIAALETNTSPLDPSPKSYESGFVRPLDDSRICRQDRRGYRGLHRKLFG